MPRRHAVFVPFLAALLAAACTGKPPAPAAPSSRPAASVRPGGSAAGVPADALARATAGRATRAVSGPVVTASIVGKIRLLSDQGAAVLSNNGAGVISNNGGSLVSNNGGGIVSDHQGGIVGKIRYGVKAGTPAAEFALADAVVTVHDAAGKMLLGPDGKPIAAITDKTGAYKLEASLPAEGVVLRVRLWTGGELAAMLPKQARGDQPIDTATSLGAAYVLDRFVRGDQKTYDKLPASEAAALRDVIEAARGELAGTPKYEPAELVGLADGLQAKAPAVAKKLEEIKLLLVGQAGLGDGRAATDVALPNLRALLVDRRGHVLMLDPVAGRIRDLAPDGTIATLADFQRGTRTKQNFPGALALLEAPDGTLIVVDRYRILRVAADGAMTTLAGNGLHERDGTAPEGEWDATAWPIGPHAAAVAPDGTVWAADHARDPRPGQLQTRLLAIRPDGKVRETNIAMVGGVLEAVAVRPDGDVVLAVRRVGVWAVMRMKPGAIPVDVATFPGVAGLQAQLALGPDGTAFVGVPTDGFLMAVGPDGAPRRIAGEGAVEAGPVTLPGAIAAAPDGTLYVADDATARVYARTPAGAWRPVAGSAGVIRSSGDLTAIALNRPFGVVFDDRGRALFTENGGFAIKRFDGTAVETVAGAGYGDAGDGGPASAARLRRPSGIAYHEGTIWVLDEGNKRLRRIGPDGVIQAAMGAAVPPNVAPEDLGFVRVLSPGQRVPADKVALLSARAVAIGPDGRPYVALNDIGQVWRLAADGMVELVAGKPAELGAPGMTARIAASATATDGMPAAELPLGAAAALAFGPTGDLYIADMYGLRVWRIEGPAGERPTARLVAGVGIVASLALASQGRQDLTKPATELGMSTPCGLAFDRAGRCLVGSMGSAALGALAPTLGLDLGEALGMPDFGSFVFSIGPDLRGKMVVGLRAPILSDPNADDALLAPTGMAVDAQGRLAIADAGASLLRIIPAGAY